MQLCARAISAGPADCLVTAYHGPLSLDQSLSLCSNPYATANTANCVITAYHGAYTLDQAIQLCQGSSKRVKLANASSAALTKDQVNELTRLANIKAVQEGVYQK
jgi:hypothetical protein